ncbi:MAG: hypothetical protein HOH43_23195 [Candidatus Latescibacteria bacterium]|nr:hypothetical protein [Candidatus Latescibacterota bacterium]
MSKKSVSTDFDVLNRHPPLMAGQEMPEFWCRTVDNGYHIFLAHPDTRRIKYPMPYEGFRSTEVIDRSIELNIGGSTRNVNLSFRPHQSILLEVSGAGNVSEIALPDVGNSI